MCLCLCLILEINIDPAISKSLYKNPHPEKDQFSRASTIPGRGHAMITSVANRMFLAIACCVDATERTDALGVPFHGMSEHVELLSLGFHLEERYHALS